MAWHGMGAWRGVVKAPPAPLAQITRGNGKRDSQYPAAEPRLVCLAAHACPQQNTGKRAHALRREESRLLPICGASPFPNVPCHFDPCLWQPAELALPLRATATRVKAMSVALVLPRYKSAGFCGVEYLEGA